MPMTRHAKPWSRAQMQYNRFQRASVAFSAITFAFYNVLMRKTTGKFGNLVAFTIVVICGTIALGLYLLVMGIPWFAGISMGNILPLLYLGVLGSGITFVSYYKGMELTSTNVGSIVFFFKPIQGTIYAIIILNERLIWDGWDE